MDATLKKGSESAVAAVRNAALPVVSSDSSERQLRLYALHKQATEGPVMAGDRPTVAGILERAKYDAWAELGEMSPEDAALELFALAESAADTSSATATSASTAATSAVAGDGTPGSQSTPGSASRPEAEHKDAFRGDTLLGKVALITGGATGICFGIAKAFVQHGATVILMSRSEDKLKESCSRLILFRRRSSRSAPLPPAPAYRVADVRNAEEVTQQVKSIVSEYGRIDILINGAAGNFLIPASRISPRAFRTVLEIDTVGTFLVSQAVYNHAFHAEGSTPGGVILNISMTLHYTGMPMQTHAGAAKAGIDAMTRHLAVEWGKQSGGRVRVNAIAPGIVEDTEGFQRLMLRSMRQEMRQLTPLGRFGRTEDIADAALYLCSDAASFVTGTVLVVDGGSWMMAGGIALSYL